MARQKLSRELSFLDELADSFCGEIANGGDSFLFHLAGIDQTGGDVGVKPLDGQHPADALLGTAAPDDWWALGVACGGWARPIEPGGQVGERSGRIATAVAVTRAGQVVSRLRVEGRTVKDPPDHGAILDVLQRSMGLATGPPVQRTGLLFAVQWLEAIIPAAAARQRDGKAVTWRDVCELHPVFSVLRAHEDGYHPVDVEIAALAMERVCDWERLRWLVVQGSWPCGNITGTEAAWFDAGSFSRWVLADHLPLFTLLDEVAHVAGSGIAKRCSRALERLNFLTRNEWRPTGA